MTALVTNNLPFVAAASNGISTLRELILELAIQGRLLKRERAAPSWQMLKLPEVATYRIGKTPPSKEARYWDDAGIPWVSISDMEHFTVLTETSRGVSKDVASETFKYPPVPAGSLLMSFKLTVGKICVLGVDGYHNEAIISLQPKEGVLRDYLMRVLPSIARAGKTKDALMGATLNSASLAELIIPLPTIEEQVRIVAKVDELMALCDRLEADQADAEAAHAQLVQALLDSLTQATDAADFRASWQRLSEHFHTLFTTEASIDALKQTVLQLAVMGKLVQQSPDDGLAHHILELAETARASSDARKRKDLEPISAELHPFELPVSWTWARIGQLSLSTEYGLSEKTSNSSNGVPVLKMGDIQGGAVLLNTAARVPHMTEGLPDLYLESGDLLYNRTNSAELVGKTGIYRGPSSAFTFASYLIRIRFDQQIVCPTYINCVMNSPCFRETQINPHLKQQCGQANVNGTVMRNMLVSLPPLAEQHRIVAKVDELMALCDQLKTQLAEACQHHAQLATVLVEQAVA